MPQLDPDASARETLRLIGPDPQNWVPDREGIDHNVFVVGGGQSGTTFAFALRRAGIGKVSLIDAARDNVLPRSSTHENSSAFLPASTRERNYFPLTCKFGTYFRLACDSILRLCIEVAPKQLENGKVPGDRACSARTADGKPQRGLIIRNNLTKLRRRFTRSANGGALPRNGIAAF